MITIMVAVYCRVLKQSLHQARTGKLFYCLIVPSISSVSEKVSGWYSAAGKTNDQQSTKFYALEVFWQGDL